MIADKQYLMPSLLNDMHQSGLGWQLGLVYLVRKFIASLSRECCCHAGACHLPHDCVNLVVLSLIRMLLHYALAAALFSDLICFTIDPIPAAISLPYGGGRALGPRFVPARISYLAENIKFTQGGCH